MVTLRCELCPRKCGVDREKGEVGYCGAPYEIVIARYSLHMWEEPIISGEKGSGTIFFSYCNMGCVFCQNYELSECHKGRSVSVSEFCDICLELQAKGAENINLVTPTMYVPLIVSGLKRIKGKELVIPVVYNTSGYECVETIKMLDGLVDIYLPDLKFYDDRLGMKYCNCPDYFGVASDAIEEMFRQVGKIRILHGKCRRGVIVRHLLMPGNVLDSMAIISYLYEKYGDDIVISIMNQYTPVRKHKYEELNRTVSDDEYDELVNFAYDLGVRRAFVQEGGTQEESFIPDFDEFKGV